MTPVRQLVAGSLVLAALGGCSAAPAPDPFGTVTGTLREVGGAPPGLDRGVRGEIGAYPNGSLTGTPIATTSAASNGEYRLRLPAGTYYLGAVSPRVTVEPRPASPFCRAFKPAVVTRGSSTAVDVVCSIK